MISVIVHIQNEEAVVGEMDSIPKPVDSMVIIKNPRRKDGKEISYLEQNVEVVVWPVTRINFIEIISDEEKEEIISFVRE
ncbi:MAG: hypothetical protein ABFD29_11730 [Anaerolineaceae bacterium]|jgi:hypothetical protein